MLISVSICKAIHTKITKGMFSTFDPESFRNTPLNYVRVLHPPQVSQQEQLAHQDLEIRSG